MPLVARLRRLAGRFTADRRGNVAIVAGFALMPLIAGAGLSVDVVLAYATEDALQKGLDAAGLAAGRAVDPADARNDAETFLRSNFASASGGAAITAFDLRPGESRDEFVLTASARMPTHFMRVFSIDEVTVHASTTIHKKVHQMELALVLDNTGSMRGSPFTTMQKAAKDLVNVVYGAEDEHPNLWVSVVPFVTAVNIGSQRLSWLEVGDPARRTKLNPFQPSPWKGCVMARPSPYDETDDPPSSKSFKSFFYPDAEDNDWTPRHRLTTPIIPDIDPTVLDYLGPKHLTGRNPATDERSALENDAYGPNLSCPSAILPLTAKKSKVLAALDSMNYWSRGGTMGNQGFVWGWATISPRWRGLWGGDTPATSPLDYEAGKTDKVVVMLTDGDNLMHNQGKPTDFTAYGRLDQFGYPNRDAAKLALNAKEGRICASMKSKGIIVYTISFGSAPGKENKDLLLSCASKSTNYFHAPDNATLKTVFKAIGQQLSELRIKR